MSPENGWLHHLRVFAALRRRPAAADRRHGRRGGSRACGSHEPPRSCSAFPVAYFIVAGSFSNLFFRYIIPVVPFLVVAAAWLVTDTVRRVTASRAALALAASLVVLPSAV